MTAALKRPAPPAEPAPPGVIVVPSTAHTPAGFRAWVESDTFPQTGRVTYLGGEIHIDMSPEQYGTHNRVKTEITRILANIVINERLGMFFSDGIRVAHDAAGVSNEPDAMFASHATIAAGRVTFPPSARNPDGFIEIDGTPDFVCEIVSLSSVGKDTRELRRRYHAAGIPEYWLIDARGEELLFDLLVHTPGGYAPVQPQDGWRASPAFAREFRLSRTPAVIGQWDYWLEDRPTATGGAA